MNAEDSGVFCSECGDEIDEVSGVCACVFSPRGPPKQTKAIVTSMRDMMARRNATRLPGEAALARLSTDCRRALVSAADGRPIGRRIASTLRDEGMLTPSPLEVAPPRHVHCNLTPLGHEVARIESHRQRSRKEKNEAPAGVE
jgi:hypothetical protein